MDTRLLRVRALYTINGAPQYILALSHKPVSVSLIPSHLIPGGTARSSPAFSSDTPIFGRAPLVPCLQAICHSSPELAPGAGRDYSVYALDPIESQARASGSGPNPVNVAIGLGLMSWSLQAANNDMTVIGTFISNGYREDSLEVIFSLREAAYTPLLPPPRRNPTADTNLRPLMTMKPLPMRRSRQSDVPAKLSRSKKPLAEPPSVADSSTGSAFKGNESVRGEDESSSLSGSSITFPADVSVPTPSSSSTLTTAADTQGVLQTLLHALATSPSKNAQLLSTLSTIDSHGASQQSNVALFEALQKLLSNVSSSNNTTVAPSALMNLSAPSHASTITDFSPTPLSLSPTLPDSPDRRTQMLPMLSSGCTVPPLIAASTKHTAPSSSKAQPQDGDDDIVILDKENVNPSAFRRRNTFSGKGKNKEMPAAVTATAASPLNKSLTAPHLISKSAHTDASASSSHNETPGRYCLEQTVRSPTVSMHGFRRGAHAFDTASEPARRPLRKRTLSEFMEERDREREARARRRRGLSATGGNANTDVHAQSEPAMPVAVSMSSPAKGKAVDRGERLKRKRYIVPEWARTTTATQPRFAGRPASRRDREESPSKRAKDTKSKQKTRKELENAQAQERARGRERTRTVLSSSDTLTSSASSISARASSATSSTAGSAPPSAVFRGEIKTLPRPIVADSSDVPVFSSPRPLASGSATASSSAVPEPPSTPVRSRNQLAEPSSNSTDLFGSPLFTPRRAQSSPRTPRLPGLYAGRNLLFSPSRHFREPTHSVRSRRLRSLSPGIRHEELENVESPSSSLPVASSDVEDSGESEDYAGEQGWSRTLALSSPLPPSSPILSPEDDWVAEQEEVDADPEAATDADPDLLTDTVVESTSSEIKADERGTTLPSSAPVSPEGSPSSVPQSFDSKPDPNQDAIPPNFGLGMSHVFLSTADNGDSGDFDFNAMFADMSGLDPAIAATSDFSVTSMPEFDFSTFTSSTDFDPVLLSSMPDPNAFLDQSEPVVATTNADATTHEVDAVFGDLAAHNGLEDMDFTQFWESMKPLVGESMRVAEAGEGEEKGATEAGEASAAAVTIDSAKLADSMQSLFSGCVM